MYQDSVRFELLDWQMKVHMVQAANTYLLIGRGGGKTVGGISPWMVRVAEAMPGHLSGIFGQTFEHLDKNIMPKIFLGFQELGYQQDVDYVVGRPPKEWPKCLYPIKKYDRVITWRNGTTWQQVSLHERGSANAFDFQSGVFDEAKFMNPEQLEDEVFPTFRGFDKLFGHKSEYLSKIFATDKLIDYARIKWLLDKRDEVDEGKLDLILAMQEKVNLLEQAKEEATASQVYKIDLALRKLNLQLTKLRKNTVFVMEASAKENLVNLGPHWWADKKTRMGHYAFKVAIENQDPIEAKEGFYPKLADGHMYEEEYPDSDLIAGQPLIVASDYQASIAPLCAAQFNGHELRFINEFYTLHPLGLEEMVDQFCEHYQFHLPKRVYYVFDQTAIGKRASAKPVFEIVIARFRKHGWSVVKIYTGDTPDHADKYVKMNSRLSKTDTGEYMMRFNKSTCKFTLISMQGAATRTSGDVTKKDKEYENTKRYPEIDQRTTTHFSDVVDQIEWAVNELKMIRPGSAVASGVSLR